MRICLLAGNMDWSSEGGTQTYFSYLAGLLARHHDVTVWTQEPPPADLKLDYEILWPEAPAPYVGGIPEALFPLVHGYTHSRWIAESLRGRRFDIVETADWGYWTVLLRPLLGEFDVQFDKLAVSLHGVLSRSFKLDWLPRFSAPVYEQVTALEHLQLATADLRIAMGHPYAAHWERQTGRPVQMILPVTPLIEWDSVPKAPEDPPDVLAIARQQRYKGGELFVQALTGVDRSLYRRAVLIGRDQEISNGRTANQRILRLAEIAGVPDIEFCDSLPRPELIRRFSERPLCVFPSLFDTFNLTALEAIMCGCPVLIARTCGISAFLEEAPADVRPPAFDADDPPKLARLISDSLGSMSRARDQAIGLRDWVRGVVTPESIVESVEKAYAAPCDRERRYPELAALARLGQMFAPHNDSVAGGNGKARHGSSSSDAEGPIDDAPFWEAVRIQSESLGTVMEQLVRNYRAADASLSDASKASTN